MAYERPILLVSAVMRRRSARGADWRSISAIHAKLYHGWQRNWHERMQSDEPQPEPVFAANTAVHTLRIAGTECLLDPKMAEDIGSFAKGLLLMNANISLAYHYPVDPSDGLDQKFSNVCLSSDAVLDPYIARLKHLHAKPPSLVYAQPVVAAAEVTQHYTDANEIRVQDDSVSIDTDVTLSRSMVYDHGVVWSGGLLCTPRVYDILRPDVEGNPFFFVREL